MDPTQDPSLAVPNTPNFINPAYATPQQRQQLYQYANALMQPQPIKNGWQGLASIAHALVGGYMGHQADFQEQGIQGTLADQQRQQIINQVSGANGALGPSGAIPAPTTYGPAPSIAGADRFGGASASGPIGCGDFRQSSRSRRLSDDASGANRIPS